MKRPARPVGFYVAARKCSECLLSPDKIVSDARRREVLDACAATGRHFVCHQSPLDGGPAVCCRGYFEAFDFLGKRVALALDRVVSVDVEPDACD